MRGRCLLRGTATRSCLSARQQPGRDYHSLVHDDRDRVVQDTLPKDDRVQLRVHLVCVEDGENSDGIGSRERRSENEAFEQGEFQSLKTEE